MIKIDHLHTFGWETAIRGMRNPMNSWEKSDSWGEAPCMNFNTGELIVGDYNVGPNDLTLMQKLVRAGSDHSKFMRQIIVSMDITAPLYWWKEYDTYKVGTVANSCSTMHKIHAKPFTREDFSCDQLLDSYDDLEELTREYSDVRGYINSPLDDLDYDIEKLNMYRELFIRTKHKAWWWQIIQRLPSSYNQLRTVTLNYAVLRNIYHSRKNHKLDEWRELCRRIESLPYAKELICYE